MLRRFWMLLGDGVAAVVAARIDTHVAQVVRDPARRARTITQETAKPAWIREVAWITANIAVWLTREGLDWDCRINGVTGLA